MRPAINCSEAECAYHDFGGLAIDEEECNALLRDLGGRKLLILRNHGALSVGATVAEAFLYLYMYERACTAQVRAQGAELNRPEERALQQVTRVTANGVGVNSMAVAAEIAWRAVRRKLDRDAPGYDF